MSTVRCLACRFLWGSTPSPHPALGRSTTARLYKRPLPRAAAAVSVAALCVRLVIRPANHRLSETESELDILHSIGPPRKPPRHGSGALRGHHIVSTTLEDAVFGQRRLSERIGHCFIPGINWRVHVGHVIARHHVERKRNKLWVSVLANFVEELLYVPIDRIPHTEWVTPRICKYVYNTNYSLSLTPTVFCLVITRRMELEANRIGLMLQATRRVAEVRMEKVMGEAMEVFPEVKS
uniref:Uncharacterized protein n=1 Tax=Oryza punctata TaxID=4537 RepID=A0A0E0K4Z6_ORYPU